MSGIQTLTRGAVNGFYLSSVLMVIVAIAAWLLMRTRLGTALTAVGLNESAVEGSGLSTTKLKMVAFLASAFVAGLGGAFYAPLPGSIAPRLCLISILCLRLSLRFCLGASTIIGPIIGAFFLTFLLEYLRPWLPGAERYFIYGGIALLLYMYPT